MPTRHGHGRLPSADPRNENFPAANALKLAGPSSRALAAAMKVTLDLRWHGDQGDSSSCVGYTGHAMLSTAPRRIGKSKLAPKMIYQGAQLYDEWPGEGYDGTSILGLLKFLVDYQPAKDVQSYYWVRKVEEISQWFRTPHRTAVPIGTNWYTSMYRTSKEGIVQVKGVLSGGHAYTGIGDDLKRGLYLFQNSWELSWSPLPRCRFWLSAENFQRLLDEDGEA